MVSKVCTKCKKEKPLFDFKELKSRKDGHKSTCRDCDKLIAKKYNDSHKKEHHEYYIRNFLQIKERKKIYSSNNKEKIYGYKKKYVKNHIERRKEQYRRYYETHKDEIKERGRKRKDKVNKSRRIYMKNNAGARMAHNLRTRLGRLLHGTKDEHMLDIVGCDLYFLQEHLKSRFFDGMTFDNYGIFNWRKDRLFELTEYMNENYANHMTIIREYLK
jgi:hypothetical protein